MIEKMLAFLKKNLQQYHLSRKDEVRVKTFLGYFNSSLFTSCQLQIDWIYTEYFFHGYGLCFVNVE